MKRAVLVLIAALGALALARALTGRLDPYDAYEVRASARAIAGDPGSPFAIYRSALLTLLEVPTEKLARATLLAWVWPHLIGVAAYVGLALGTMRLGRAAGLAPWAAAMAAAAIACDRVAFHDAPLGLPDALAACLATWGLALGLEKRLVPATLLLGLAAAARPNAGLAVVPLLGALVVARDARRGLALAAGSFAIYLLVESLFFLLGGARLRGHLDLAAFQREQFAENARRYGAVHSPLSVYLRALVALEPGTALVAPFGVALALLRPTRERIVLLGLALLHAAFLTRLVGHGEARYLLPTLPALAVLGAGAVEQARLPERARGVVLVLWVALPLALGGPFEARRAVDPLARRGFSQEVARTIAAVDSTSGRVFWTPDLPFPVYPEVLAREGTPFPGDPFHGIAHAGPLTVGYHLERPVLLLQRRGERGEVLPGVAREQDLPRLAGALKDGDLVLLGAAEPGLSWTLKAGAAPAIRIYRFAGGAFGLVAEVGQR